MITYTFNLENGESYVFEIDPDRIHDPKTPEKAFYTALDYKQCSVCTLSTDEYNNCPPAADLQDVVDRFSKILSVADVEVYVETEQRIYYKKTDAQTGLDALLGLMMATSCCPVLGKFSAMARTHLPFATYFESTSRSIGTYLLKQYFVMQDGGKPDWELKGLMEFYEEITIVNEHFADRVRDASEKDAGVNAVIQLSALSIVLGSSIEEQLDEFKVEFLGS